MLDESGDAMSTSGGAVDAWDEEESSRCIPNGTHKLKPSQPDTQSEKISRRTKERTVDRGQQLSATGTAFQSVRRRHRRGGSENDEEEESSSDGASSGKEVSESTSENLENEDEMSTSSGEDAAQLDESEVQQEEEFDYQWPQDQLVRSMPYDRSDGLGLY